MFTIAEIVAATGGELIGSAAGAVCGISTDSRKIRPGELFVPLRGERFDGHNYLQEVGTVIRTSLCSRDWANQHHLTPGMTAVVVPDTLRALGDLATAWRKRFAPLMIGVTGSNGKTTTKEMLATVLSQRSVGLKTSGNLNNLIGLPQMLFQLTTEHRWAVLEMGMSEPGEIDRLAEIADPAIGVVLNAFPAHLQSMGSVEAVAQAKGELLHRIHDNGLAVVNADDPRIACLHQNQSARRISFGIKRGEVRAESIRSRGVDGQELNLVTPRGTVTVCLRALGQHAVYNALATTAALMEQVGLEEIAEGLELFQPYSGRFRTEPLHDNRVLIDDSYNANPASCAAALNTLHEIKGECRAVVVLGDMRELGTDELELHRQLGQQAAGVADQLYLLGTLTAETAAAAVAAGMSQRAVHHAATHQEIVDALQADKTAGELILVKGSRGMKMDTIAAALRAAEQQEG